MLRKILKALYLKIFVLNDIENLNIFRRNCVRIVQFLNENGFQGIWNMNIENYMLYVKKGVSENASVYDPVIYRNNRKSDTVDLILDRLKEYISPELSVIDVGCSAGSNLLYFMRRGFLKLAGIDINPFAERVMKESYPDLYKIVKLYIGPVDQVALEIKENAYDVCVVMGFAKYIHPKQNIVFSEIARMARGYVLTVENEITFSSVSYPRNLKKVFNKYNCKEIETFTISREKFPWLSDSNYFGCTVRLFQKI